MSKKYIFQYASLTELVELAVNGKSEVPNTYRSSREHNDKWAGATWEQAVSMGQGGDIEGARRLAPAMLKLANEMQNHAPRLDPVYRVDEGRWIDVARFVKGEPECWGDMVESEPTPRRGINIIVNVSASANIHAGTLDGIGVHIGSALLGLQARGMQVGLYACECVQAGNRSDTYMYINAAINPGGGPLDASRLSVILRPWFLRRILFSALETYPLEVRDAVGSFYGSPRPIGQKMADELTGKPGAVELSMQEMAKLSGYEIPDYIARKLQKGGY